MISKDCLFMITMLLLIGLDERLLSASDEGTCRACLALFCLTQFRTHLRLTSVARGFGAADLQE
jgi:hypothetical protein